MAKPKNTMTILEPVYYGKFACIADRCRYNCCQGWEVTMSRAEYSKLRSARVSPGLKKKIADGLKRRKGTENDGRYADMVLDGEFGLCHFCDPDGLCSLIKECGPSITPNICQSFPRISILTGDRLQRSCSTGCEVVIELLEQEKGGLRFVELEEPYDRQRHAANAVFNVPKDRALESATLWSEIQALCISILQDRRYTLSERIILLGVALGDLAPSVEANTVADWLRRRSALVMGDPASIQESLAALPASKEIFVLNALAVAKEYSIENGRCVNKKWGQFMEDCLAAIGVVSDVKAVVQVNFAGPDGNALEGDIFYDPALYQKAVQARDALTGGDDYLLENVLVNYIFHTAFPLISRDIWGDYMIFCQMYNFLQVMCTAYVGAHPERDAYIYALTVCSRSWHHNKMRQQVTLAGLKAQGTNTLAHMAMLVKE